MATQPNLLDAAQLQGVVSWLEEQHRQDRESLGRLASEVDRLVLVAREQAIQIGELRGAIEQGRGALERLPLVDEALKQEREQVAQLVERFDAHAQQMTHALMLRAADAERDRRQVAELTQSVAQVEREDQALTARFRALADEARRDRALLTELPKTLEELQARVHQISNRADTAEDGVRRVDNLGTVHAQELETIRAELSRSAQWRQMAELRQARQVAEWQQMIDNWRQTAEDQQRPVQHLTQQVAQAREEGRTTAGALSDAQRRQDEFAASLARLDSSLAQTREGQARLEQAMDAQRRRFDEQASAQLRLDEAIGRVVEHRQSVEANLSAHGRQLDELGASMRAAEAGLARLRDDHQSAQSAARQDAEAIRAQVANQVERLEAAARTFADRVVDFERVSQEHRSRLALELEQQARELGELTARFRPT